MSIKCDPDIAPLQELTKQLVKSKQVKKEKRVVKENEDRRHQEKEKGQIQPHQKNDSLY